MKVIAIFSSMAMAAAISATATAADALTTFTYRVKVPSLSGMTCAQNAQNMAATFAAANGKAVTNVTGACSGQQPLQNQSVDIVVISYQAKYEVMPYRASFAGEQTAGESFGETFATYASCVSALSTQASMFNAETGLTAVAAYCDGGDNDMVTGYKLNIDGFGGEPQKRLSSFMGSYPVNVDYTKIIPIAANLIASAGGDIAYQDSLRIFYYSAQAIGVGVANFSFYPEAQCQDQMGIAEKIATGSGQTNVTGLCLADQGLSSLVVVGLGSAGNVEDDFGTRSPDYMSYSECVTDRPRMTANYGSSLLGALCEPSMSASGHYQIHLFTRVL